MLQEPVVSGRKRRISNDEVDDDDHHENDDDAELEEVEEIATGKTKKGQGKEVKFKQLHFDSSHLISVSVFFKNIRERG